MSRLHHRQQPAVPIEGGGTVRKFPAPSLMCQIAEVRRERSMRERTGWDYYDCSLELHGMPPEFRLTVDQQKAIATAGFIKCYVNHTDKWETHYSWTTPELVAVEGWRVSYPHKRGEGGGAGIWVEEITPSCPAEWFATGYAIVKERPVSPTDPT